MLCMYRLALPFFLFIVFSVWGLQLEGLKSNHVMVSEIQNSVTAAGGSCHENTEDSFKLARELQ